MEKGEGRKKEKVSSVPYFPGKKKSGGKKMLPLSLKEG